MGAVFSRTVLPPPISIISMIDSRPDENSILLYPFSDDPFCRGQLTFGKVHQIQLEILSHSWGPCTWMFNSPFNRLKFKSDDEFNTFKTHLIQNYTVEIKKQDEELFDVFLVLKPTVAELKQRNLSELSAADQNTLEANLKYKEKNFVRAVQLHILNIEIFQRLAPDSLESARNYEKLGWAYVAQKNFSKALDCYSESLAIRERFPINLEKAECYLSLGKIYQEQKGQAANAISHLEHAFSIFHRLLPGSLKLAYVHICRGRAYESDRQFKNAERDFNNGLTLQQRIQPGGLAVADSHVLLGLFYYKRENHALAIEHFEKFISIFVERKRGAFEICEVHLLLADAYEKMNNPVMESEHFVKCFSFILALPKESIIHVQKEFLKMHSVLQNFSDRFFNLDLPRSVRANEGKCYTLVDKIFHKLDYHSGAEKI